MGLTERELCPAGGQASAGSTEWFALHVKHQHERSVEAVLSANRTETFLPLYRARRRWSDRVKEIDVPLFPGYIFGRFPLNERVGVLRTPGVNGIVGFGGSPAPVPEAELDNVRAALASKLPFGPWPYPREGDRVLVVRGPLQGIEGTLLRERDGLRLVLGVELLHRSLAVEVESDMIAPAHK